MIQGILGCCACKILLICLREDVSLALKLREVRKLGHGWLAAAKGARRTGEESREHAADGFVETWKLWGVLMALV
jgi:hypothetical protein